VFLATTQNVSVAAEFQPLNSAEMRAVEALVAGHVDAAFFKCGAAGFGVPDAADGEQMDLMQAGA
jgi:hypothetical protein